MSPAPISPGMVITDPRDVPSPPRYAIGLGLRCPLCSLNLDGAPLVPGETDAVCRRREGLEDVDLLSVAEEGADGEVLVVGLGPVEVAADVIGRCVSSVIVPATGILLCVLSTVVWWYWGPVPTVGG